MRMPINPPYSIYLRGTLDIKPQAPELAAKLVHTGAPCYQNPHLVVLVGLSACKNAEGHQPQSIPKGSGLGFRV